jgi:hypothetical protein
METQRFFTLKRIKQLLFIVMLISIVNSCVNASKSDDKLGLMEEVNERVKESDGDVNSEDFNEFGGFKIKTTVDGYVVTLDVTKSFCLHNKGVLRVWIGHENFIPKEREEFVRDITAISSKIGVYAKVTPFAPDFDVQPENSECMMIHESGSSVLFTLTPQRKGEFKVSSKVELFETSDCSGTPIPKTSETLTVVVTVDKMEVFENRMGELFSIFWDKFLSFWGVLISIIFGFLLFILRKLLKKKTGYNHKE